MGDYIPNPHYVAPLARVCAALKIVGLGATTVGVALDGMRLYSAYQHSQSTGDFESLFDEGARVVGGWSGAIALGTACAKAGAWQFKEIAKPWGALAGAVVCGVAGSVVGYHGGSRVARGAFSDAGTIALSFRGGANARRVIAIGSSVSQVASGISTMIAAKAAMSAAGALTASAAFSFVTGGLSIVAGLVSLMGALFDDDEADILGAALVEVHADLRALRQDMREEIRTLGRELQRDIRTLGRMVSQVMVNDEIILHAVHQLQDSIHELKVQLSEHVQTTNLLSNILTNTLYFATIMHFMRVLWCNVGASGARSLSSLHSTLP